MRPERLETNFARGKWLFSFLGFQAWSQPSSLSTKALTIYSYTLMLALTWALDQMGVE